jgi:DNA repair protein RecO (recombination protein O)
MEWSDEGVLLTARRHGESAAVIEVFTEAHGRHAGLVRGGGSRRRATHLQPGAQVSLTWRARLADHVGTFRVEPLRGRLGALMGDRLALAGLEAMTGLLVNALPERAPCPDLYARTVTVMDLIPVTDAWPLAYLQWELALLESMGFGLDLSRCAVTGAKAGLRYVSPRTGRAVSADGAGAHAERLLPLPPCLLGRGAAPNPEIATALKTTGHFLARHLAANQPARPFPPGRGRLADLLARAPQERDE